MDLVSALLLLQLVSGLCMNLISVENYLRNNTLLETARDSIGKSYQELGVNNDKPTRPKRIFKVVPVNTNNKWNKKLLVQPDLRHLTEDVPVALIVAANGDFYNLKFKNDSQVPLTDNNVNITENKPQNIDVTTLPYNVPFINNDVESNIISNLGRRIPASFQSMITSSEPHIIDDSKKVFGTKEVKEDKKSGENDDPKEHNIEKEREFDLMRKEPLDKDNDGDDVNSYEDESITSVTSKSPCNEIETKSDNNAVELHFGTRKCFNGSRKFLHDLNTHERDFNVFFVLKN